MKAMLVRKNRKVAMKSKRRWKKFWGKKEREGGSNKMKRVRTVPTFGKTVQSNIRKTKNVLQFCM